MSLTEALRAGAPEAFGALYDEHAERLYAYCHVMVGDEAADAVRDAFISVARHPGTTPSDDAALPVWLHALARAECVRRGALVRKAAVAPSADPLRRALARLRPEHREVLALSLTLEPNEVARVIGVATDTAETLVRVSRRRLEQASASVLGTVYDEPMLAALSSGNLHKLVTRGSSTPPRQRDRVLFSCAAAERAADGALLFDQDGMPIPLDSLFGAAEDVTHPFAVVSAEQAPSPVSPEVATEPSTDPIRRVGAAGRPSRPRVHHGRTRKDDTKESFLSRRRDGLAEAVGLAACVAAATGALALWPSPHGGGASNMDGTSLLLHRGAPASHSAQPVPSGDGVPGAPPQAATSKPGASPTPSTTTTAPATAPPTTTGPDRPAPPPVSGPPSTEQPAPTPTESSPTSEPSTPTTTPTPDPTPTPSDTPTDANSDTPTPDPSSP